MEWWNQAQVATVCWRGRYPCVLFHTWANFSLLPLLSSDSFLLHSGLPPRGLGQKLIQHLHNELKSAKMRHQHLVITMHCWWSLRPHIKLGGGQIRYYMTYRFLFLPEIFPLCLEVSPVSFLSLFPLKIPLSTLLQYRIQYLDCMGLISHYIA